MIVDRRYAVNKLHFKEDVVIDDYMLLHLVKILDQQNGLDQNSKIRNEDNHTIWDKDTRTQFKVKYDSCGNIHIVKASNHNVGVM